MNLRIRESSGERKRGDFFPILKAVTSKRALLAASVDSKAYLNTNVSEFKL